MFETIWQNIYTHAGETFHLIGGTAFEYETHEGYIFIPRVNQRISKSDVEQAVSRLPLKNTVPLQDLRAPAYLYALLQDSRIVERQTYELSIVVPTLNREKLLPSTVELLCKQVADCPDRVQLIVAGNAADPETETIVRKLQVSYPFLQFHGFPDRVEVDLSFQRSALLASAEWVWVFGDDDFPLCGAVSYLLKMIGAYPGTDFIHFEVLNADTQNRNGYFRFILHTFKEELFPGPEFIENVMTRPVFITSFVTRTKHWQGDFDFQRYDGYGFLAMLYQHIFSGNAILCPEPLAIQRASISVWKPRWPRMFLLSNARAIEDLPFDTKTKARVMQKWADSFQLKGVLYSTLLAITAKFHLDPLWQEALSYQRPAMRKWMKGVAFFVPCWIANILVKIAIRRKK